VNIFEDSVVVRKDSPQSRASICVVLGTLDELYQDSEKLLYIIINLSAKPKELTMSRLNKKCTFDRFVAALNCISVSQFGRWAEEVCER
jgi:hypothetical protein